MLRDDSSSPASSSLEASGLSTNSTLYGRTPDLGIFVVVEQRTTNLTNPIISSSAEGIGTTALPKQLLPLHMPQSPVLSRPIPLQSSMTSSEEFEPINRPFAAPKVDGKESLRRVRHDESHHSTRSNVRQQRSVSLDDTSSGRDSRAPRSAQSIRAAAEGSRLGGTGTLNKRIPPSLTGSVHSLTTEAEELRSRLAEVNKEISIAVTRAQGAKALTPRRKYISSSKSKTVSMAFRGSQSPDDLEDDLDRANRDSSSVAMDSSRARKMFSRGTSKSGKTSSFSRSLSDFDMDDEEVNEHVRTISKYGAHGRTMSSVQQLTLKVARDQKVHEDTHEETFFELFYDLILVVVFIKLSYLKYDLSIEGMLTVAAIFANFWSCWSLMNCYVTMLHTEDVLHRMYYVVHISLSFLMAISIQDPDHAFFHYGTMALYHAVSSAITRSVTLVMWLYALRNDLESSKHAESMYAWQNNHAQDQIMVHAGTLMISIALFMTSALIAWEYVGSKSGTDDENASNTMLTAGIWLLAVSVEQFGSSYGAIYMDLPFAASYAGERMQAWLMLCFGEAVIALLIEPIYYDEAQLVAISTAFFMILCICTAYFDVVDAKEFLHLYCLRGEKLKGFVFMNFQYFFSFLVFLSGVSLKTIIFVEEARYELEIESGCSSQNRRLEGILTGWPSSPRKATTSASVSRWRQLQVGYDASWKIEELDGLLNKSFMMLTISCGVTMASSMLIGYSMPSGLSAQRLHLSRIGSCFVALTTIVVPSYIKSIATPCLLAVEAGISEFESSNDDGTGVIGGERSLELMQALVIISCLILVSFMLSLGSLDPNRDATYALLEERATYRKAKAHLERQKRASTMLEQLMGVASNAAVIAAGAAGNMAHAVRNGTPLRTRWTSNDNEVPDNHQSWAPGQASPPRRPSTPRRMGRSSQSSRNLRQLGEARAPRELRSKHMLKVDEKGDSNESPSRKQHPQAENSRDTRNSDESVVSTSSTLRRNSKNFGLASSLHAAMGEERKS